MVTENSINTVKWLTHPDIMMTYSVKFISCVSLKAEVALFRNAHFPTAASMCSSGETTLLLLTSSK